MQDVAKYTKLTPRQRVDEARTMLNKLKNSELYKIQQD